MTDFNSIDDLRCCLLGETRDGGQVLVVSFSHTLGIYVEGGLEVEGVALLLQGAAGPEPVGQVRGRRGRNQETGS